MEGDGPVCSDCCSFCIYSRRLKKVTKLVAASRGDEVPAEFSHAMKKIVPLESTAQLLMIAVIVLMVIKPF
ncbi:UNVERIFIED_CONTAM: membrane protein required for beta-lactamase induction [Brevibacillus sp. OAP136]